MSCSENLILRNGDCDMYGRWKPSALLLAMQEVATAHCDSIGLSRKVTDSLGVFWVLSRCRVELSRLPRIGEKYTLETFAMPIRHLFFPRAHVLRGEDGEVIGKANGLWMLMDAATRKTVKDPFVVERLPIEGTLDIRMPGTVRLPEGECETGSVTPRFTEFDLNGHVNNTKYLDWCWNALGFDYLASRTFACFEVNYDREIRRGEEIETRLHREDHSAVFCGFHGDQRCFGISMEMREAE